MDNNMKVLEDYFKNDENVRKTVDRLLSLKIEDLRLLETGRKKCLWVFVDEMVNIEDLDKEACEKMSYLELVSMLHQSKESDEYDFCYPNSSIHAGSKENYLFYADMVTQFFYDACNSSTTIRKFMLLPLRRMCEVFGAGYLWSFVSRGYRKLKNISGTELDCETLTVKKVLDACRETALRCWHPVVMNPDEYIANVRFAHEIEAMLLIGGFRTVYPEYYNSEEIREKYARQYDGMENGEDEWDLDMFEAPESSMK